MTYSNLQHYGLFGSWYHYTFHTTLGGLVPHNSGWLEVHALRVDRLAWYRKITHFLTKKYINTRETNSPANKSQLASTGCVIFMYGQYHLPATKINAKYDPIHTLIIIFLQYFKQGLYTHDRKMILTTGWDDSTKIWLLQKAIHSLNQLWPK